MSNSVRSTYALSFHPRRFVAIYNMLLRFHSIAFFHLLDQMRLADTFMDKAVPTAQVSVERKSSWQRMIQVMIKASTEIGLRVVPLHLGTLVADETVGLTEAQLKRAISSTHDMFFAELSTQLMFVVPYPDDDLYKSSEKAFGEEVYNSFLSARFDITEASKCLALDRPTACVLHLMRALEAGLNVLAKQLRIPYVQVNWEQVLNKIPARIKEIEGARRKPKRWKELRQFYAETGAHLDLVKDAFRNWAMHIHKTYDPVTAKELFQHSKAFMRHLATQLSES